MNKPLFPDVTVNGEVIEHRAIAAETQHHTGPSGKPGIVWRKAANALVIRTLLLQEAARRKIEAAPEELGPGKFELPEDASIRGLLEEAIVVGAPSEDGVRAAYDADPSKFRSPPLWEVSHILIACDPEDEAKRATALARAEALLEIVQKTPKGFAALAKAESDCDSKSNGGSLGQLRPGDTVPEVERVFHDMAAGEITRAPLLSRHGYHIIRMDAVAEGQVLPFETVRDRIAGAMEDHAKAMQSRQFVADLIAAATITGTDLK